jgi:UDP-3-O-[3-hydroxymyristoyl] N-acetylglucosamine deacetylase/3-hydroxyacyl-[acyl-carrier-protein] dehydratase
MENADSFFPSPGSILMNTSSDNPIITDLPRQHTVAGTVRVEGTGLLLGQPATVEIKPAPEETGIVFERVDLDPPVRIQAIGDRVVPRAQRTTLKSGDTTIETIEHCMSALAGLAIDNAVIELSGPELPCGDGSAQLFVDPILKVGIQEQDSPRRIFKLVEPIVIEEGGKMISAVPSDDPGTRIVFDLDYGAESTRIPRQAVSFNPSSDSYQDEIAPARTYSLREEAEALWERGMCRHLTPKEVLVIGEDGPIENSFRFRDEPVRHKVLDALGDLYLAGRPVQCRILAYRSGHALNRQLVMKIREQMAQQDRRSLLLEGKAMDARAIQKLMPHRFPMLLVDRLLHVDGDQKAVGVKNVTINEPFFQGHYPGTPIMPGVLIVEAMAQMGGLLMSRKLEHTGKIAVLLSLDKVKLRRPVVPGDQLIMEAETIRATARTGNVKCRSLVGDKVVAEAQIKFMMVDSETE